MKKWAVCLGIIMLLLGGIVLGGEIVSSSSGSMNDASNGTALESSPPELTGPVPNGESLNITPYIKLE